MHFIDSHTGGQSTRVILDGGPDLGQGPLSERLAILSSQHDVFRRQTILEPKCSDAMVGALLCEPTDPESSAGVIFFNASGYLGMCGHGLIGLMVTLNHLGLITQGEHWIETPVGKVKASYLGDNKVQIENVDSYRLKKDVILEVEGLGVVSGDIAWGGNWFFLTHAAPCDITPQNIPALTKAAWAIRKRLSRLNITGERGAEIDHIEFFQSSRSPHSDSINFVLCPGGAYDRSPCGTGTSAKLACLAADGHLKPDKRWTQESVIGSKFEGIYQRSAVASRIVPQITGQAYVYADGRLILDPNDPFLHGIK